MTVFAAQASTGVVARPPQYLPREQDDPVQAVRATLSRFAMQFQRPGDLADRRYTMTPGINVPKGWKGFYHTETYREGDLAMSVSVRTTGLLDIDEDHVYVAFRQRQRTFEGEPIDTGDPERVEWAEDRVSMFLSLSEYAAVLDEIKAASYRSTLPKPARMNSGH